MREPNRDDMAEINNKIELAHLQASVGLARIMAPPQDGDQIVLDVQRLEIENRRLRARLAHVCERADHHKRWHHGLIVACAALVGVIAHIVVLLAVAR